MPHAALRCTSAVDRQGLHRAVRERVRRTVELVQIDRPDVAHDIAAHLRLLAEDADRHGAPAVGALALEGIEATSRWADNAEDARVDVTRVASAILRTLGLRI